MKRALERQEAGEARVIPILMYLLDWTNAPFAQRHMVLNNDRPLTTQHNEDVALGIRHVIEAFSVSAVSVPRVDWLAIWNVPYPRHVCFLRRDTELAQGRSHLRSGTERASSRLLLCEHPISLNQAYL